MKMFRNSRGRTRPNRVRRRVHRHLFRTPVEGILIGAWGFDARASVSNRLEEEA